MSDDDDSQLSPDGRPVPEYIIERAVRYELENELPMLSVIDFLWELNADGVVEWAADSTPKETTQ